MGIAGTSTRNNPGARKSLGQFSEMFNENQKTASGKLSIVKEKQYATRIIT